MPFKLFGLSLLIFAVGEVYKYYFFDKKESWHHNITFLIVVNQLALNSYFLYLLLFKKYLLNFHSKISFLIAYVTLISIIIICSLLSWKLCRQISEILSITFVYICLLTYIKF